MKDKRIWLVILCILTVGVSVTRYTRSMVKSQTNSTVSMSEVSAAAFGLSGETPEGISNADGAGAAEEEMQDIKGRKAEMGSAQGETAEEISRRLREMPEPALAAAPETAGARQEDSPEAPAVSDSVPNAARSAAFGTEKKADFQSDSSCDGGIYRQRLNELDAQIQKMQGEKKDPNVYSIKTSAETEVLMWDKELNTVYNALLEVLPQEQKEDLAKEQNEWVREREIAAAGQSGKGDGVGVSYAASLVELTRNRAYELADRYETAVCGAHDLESESSMAGEGIK